MESVMGIVKDLLLKEVENSNEKNIVLSPISLNLILNMLATGSSGLTLKHMLGFLGSKSIMGINSESSKMMALVKSDDEREGGPILTMVNGAWVDKHFLLKSSYEKVIKDIYNCEVKNVDFDFVNKADKVVHEVNSWVESVTRGIIKNILDSASLSCETTLVMTNGLHFKGTWVNEFVERCIENRDFYLLNGDAISVPFMNSNKKYHFGSFNGFKVLKIPYQRGKLHKRSFSMYENEEVRDRKFSMYFFLPNKRDGLSNLLKNFNFKSRLLEKNLKLRQVTIDELWIPKFKISYDFDVLKAMKDIGAPILLFTKNSANFTKMVNVPKGLKFFVSNIFQNACIKINEKGTEATAVTLITGGCRAALMGPPKIKSFIPDHSFMFIIKEESSEFVFFIGTVLNPI